jgi:hypothetical protein
VAAARAFFGARRHPGGHRAVTFADATLTLLEDGTVSDIVTVDLTHP